MELADWVDNGELATVQIFNSWRFKRLPFMGANGSDEGSCSVSSLSSVTGRF